jgi:nitric oxide synthase-interacting protein
MSDKPISLKELIEVKFKLLEDSEDKRSMIVKSDRYVCAVSGDVLNNSVPSVVLKTSLEFDFDFLFLNSL